MNQTWYVAILFSILINVSLAGASAEADPLPINRSVIVNSGDTITGLLVQSFIAPTRQNVLRFLTHNQLVSDDLIVGSTIEIPHFPVVSSQHESAESSYQNTRLSESRQINTALVDHSKISNLNKAVPQSRQSYRMPYLPDDNLMLPSHGTANGDAGRNEMFTVDSYSYKFKSEEAGYVGPDDSLDVGASIVHRWFKVGGSAQFYLQREVPDYWTDELYRSVSGHSNIDIFDERATIINNDMVSYTLESSLNFTGHISSKIEFERYPDYDTESNTGELRFSEETAEYALKMVDGHYSSDDLVGGSATWYVPGDTQLYLEFEHGESANTTYAGFAFGPTAQAAGWSLDYWYSNSQEYVSINYYSDFQFSGITAEVNLNGEYEDSQERYYGASVAVDVRF